MSPLYTDEIETLAFDGICFHVGHYQNKQQNDSWRQQEDLQQLWIHIPTGKSLGVAENPTEAWRIQMASKLQFFRRLDVSLDCLKWITDPYLIWKQLLPQLVAVTSVLSQSLAPKHTKQIVKKWTTNWKPSVVIFQVSLVKSTNTSSNSFVKIVLRSDILVFSMSIWKIYDVYLSFYMYLR